jgi:putative transposase
MERQFTDEQVVGFLKEAEAGTPIKELCRKQGFSAAAFYGLRSRFGGMEVAEVSRLRNLEAENNRLKKLLAEAHLGIEALKSVVQGSGKPAGASGSDRHDAGSNNHL